MQAAQEQIGALVKGAQAAIQKDARAAEAALAQGAKAHADALERHEEALRQLHAAYEAAVAAEWGRMQASSKRQAAFIKVAVQYCFSCMLAAVIFEVGSMPTAPQA